MQLPHLVSRFRSKLTVFRHADAGSDPAVTHPAGETWVLADPAGIDALFARDAALRKHFRRFLEAGCIGVFLTRDEQWVSYGWISTPDGWVPPHLPRWVARLGGYWFFHGHTKQAFRGQGCFKRLLARRVAVIKERDPEGAIYVDTDVSKFASRRALQSVGFRACGVLITYKLWVPRLGSRVLYGSWSRNETHPPVPLARRMGSDAI